MQKLSATIITFNEEKNIRKCLNSLLWVDEIVIVDSESTDNTVNICREFTEKIFIEKWAGYGKQKNLCAQKATYAWILNIDADEVISKELKNNIKKILSSKQDCNSFKVPRKNYVNNKWIKHGGWYPDYIIRLYNKSSCKFSNALVHESIIMNGVPGILKGNLEHYSYTGFDDFFIRIEKYSTLSAYEMIRKKKNFHWYNLLLHPPLNFIKKFILKFGFLDGYKGFILAGGYSCYVFKKYLKLKYLNKNRA